jgi:hypothetical protein
MDYHASDDCTERLRFLGFKRSERGSGAAALTNLRERLVDAIAPVDECTRLPNCSYIYKRLILQFNPLALTLSRAKTIKFVT